jgi:hypothetical protein
MNSAISVIRRDAMRKIFQEAEIAGRKIVFGKKKCIFVCKKSI